MAEEDEEKETPVMMPLDEVKTFSLCVLAECSSKAVLLLPPGPVPPPGGGPTSCMVLRSSKMTLKSSGNFLDAEDFALLFYIGFCFEALLHYHVVLHGGETTTG